MTDTDAQAAIERRFGAHLPLAGARLAGMSALISGAGAAGEVLGTGAATAVLFAAQGAAVTIFDVDPARAENTARIIEDWGGRALVVAGDVRSSADCARAISESVERFGGLDVLVNNTAVVRIGDITTVTEADWDASIDVNLKGVMLLSQAAAAQLTQRRGAIINVASIAALQGFGVVAYAASKGGVVAMTRDMAYSLGRGGVRVNCLVPGHLATPMGGSAHPQTSAPRRRAPLLDVEGTGWDVAWAAAFLASPEARWITAATLNVDAGSTSYPSIKAQQQDR